MLYAMALYDDADASLDDLREAVTTLEETSRIARRVLGGSHPNTAGIEEALRHARAALRAREESFRRNELAAARAASDALNAELEALIEASRLENARAALRAREESVRLREAAIRLREEAVLHEDRAAAAQAVFDALNAEIEASRLENARAALRARETPPPSPPSSESA
jgi:hypothetical protein